MEIIKQQYASGLRSLSVLSKDTEAVTVMFLVAVGSRYESDAESGLAHFVEHTLFKGTPSRPTSKQIGMEIESLGGSSNAFTSYDYTGYYIKSPALNFAKSFEILADIFQHSQFKQEELDKERGVIIEEIRMYEDKPQTKLNEEWLHNFFQGNTLAKDIAGTIESVKAMQREQFLQFIEKHYYGQNVLLVVAGNVEQAEVEKLVAQHCGEIKPRGERAASAFGKFSFDANKVEKQLKITKDVEQTHLIIGGLGLEREHPDRFALNVANTILGSGFGSKLFQVIRDELGLAYYVYSSLTQFSDTGLFAVGMGVDSRRVDEALAAAKKEILAVAAGEFDQAEFERAKNFLLGGLVTDLETSEDLAMFYGMQELLQQEKLTLDEVRDRIMAVQIGDITRVAQQYFKADNLYTAQLSR